MEMSNRDCIIISLKDRRDLNERAATWFHEKWNIPEEAYLESILEGQRNPSGVPLWYLVFDQEDRIIGGLGVIENDFHKRKDLTPNVCAVYVEKEYRKHGVAKAMLDRVCHDAGKMGYTALYLITEHEQFYEKCGWHFLCMVEEDSGHMTRMYEINI